jgi:GxxExxY protein
MPKCGRLGTAFYVMKPQILLEVHSHLGPGLLESAYEQCLARELQLNGIDFRLQHPLPVEYKGVKIGCGYKADMFVGGSIVLELRCVEKLLGIHEAQLLTYMRLAGAKQGFLINFNVKRLRNGIKSMVL